jgi:enterochelin esterase-like enzyme
MHPLIQRAQHEGTPLFDGEQVTFVWQGDTQPSLMGDFTAWGHHLPVTLRRVDSDVWAYTRSFAPDAYIEYAFYLNEDRQQRVPDPYNPRTIWNGINADNHYFYMPDAQQDEPYIVPLPKAQRGTVTRYRIDNPNVRGYLPNAARGRGLWLYQPTTDDPVPLLVVFDGADYYRRAKITTIVDNLIARGEIRPIALALIENAGWARFMEYAASESTLMFLHNELLPFAAQHLRLVSADDDAGAHGVLGASMGGIMALYAGLRLPRLFGHVVSQSGAFQVDPQFPFAVFDLARHQPTLPRKLWLDCGIYEPLLIPNQAMAALLRERGIHFNYHEYSGGHNYTAWRRLLPQALTTIYGKP